MATVTVPVTGGAMTRRRDAELELELLRLSTAGSVDDGKSTLIGRLLYDSKGVYEDQIASIRKDTLDLALITDGLRAEREQGITIDVAYRYFSTPRRKFIIADTPGHEQYTRNMATGASTANLAIILIDARNGVLQQSRRHAFIASLLGIPHTVVAVNKMDLVDFGEQVFNSIRTEFGEFAAQLGLKDLIFIPLSALLGDNVVTGSHNMPWYTGPTLLEHLETVPITHDRNLSDMRFPVQYVIRPNLDFRGYAGQVASGTIHAGDPVVVLPSGRTSRVKSIVTYDGELAEAFPPMAVTVCLEDEIDISRGDMLAHPDNLPHVATRFEAIVVWMNETPLEPRRPYLIKHTSQQGRATVTALRHRLDVDTLERQPASELRLNEIGEVAVETFRPLFFDPYRRNRATGAFILIDAITNETVGAGMITGRARQESATHRVTAEERSIRLGHHAFTIWLRGTEEQAYALERRLFDRGCLANVVPDARAASVLNEAGLIGICLAAGDPPEGAVPVEGESSPDEICRMLEAQGYIEGERFTGGAGI
jgi:sulfate adenylyltransferase large subunit